MPYVIVVFDGRMNATDGRVAERVDAPLDDQPRELALDTRRSEQEVDEHRAILGAAQPRQVSRATPAMSIWPSQFDRDDEAEQL
jgi:hypothetical protein